MDEAAELVAEMFELLRVKGVHRAHWSTETGIARGNLVRWHGQMERGEAVPLSADSVVAVRAYLDRARRRPVVGAGGTQIDVIGEMRAFLDDLERRLAGQESRRALGETTSTLTDTFVESQSQRKQTGEGTGE